MKLLLRGNCWFEESTEVVVGRDVAGHQPKHLQQRRNASWSQRRARVGGATTSRYKGLVNCHDVVGQRTKQRAHGKRRVREGGERGARRVWEKESDMERHGGGRPAGRGSASVCKWSCSLALLLSVVQSGLGGLVWTRNWTRKMGPVGRWRHEFSGARWCQALTRHLVGR